MGRKYNRLPHGNPYIHVPKILIIIIDVYKSVDSTLYMRVILKGETIKHTCRTRR